MTLPLPDPYVGGPIADADPRETLKERFDGTQRNFEALALAFPLGPQHLAAGVLKLAVQGTERKVAFGSATVATPAAANLFDVTVTHGLGATPVIVVANTRHGNYHASIVSRTATEFTARCVENTLVVVDPGDFDLLWLAIG